VAQTGRFFAKELAGDLMVQANGFVRLLDLIFQGDPQWIAFLFV